MSMPRIYTRCPARHNDTLTVNDDQHLLCTWLKCPDPTLIDRIGEIENGRCMSDERFNELLNGPLSHPFPMFTMTRLAHALRAVVDATGKVGVRALEDHCASRQQQDDRDDASAETEDWA